jgi:amino acid transporter
VYPNPLPPAAPVAAAVPEVHALAPRLGLFDITMLVVGSVIGGHLRGPAHRGGPGAGAAPVLAAWGIGGLISMAGGIVYADLARRRPAGT